MQQLCLKEVPVSINKASGRSVRALYVRKRNVERHCGLIGIEQRKANIF